MKTTGAAPSHPKQSNSWSPTYDDLKCYPHFDAPLKLSEIRAIVNDPIRVAQNAFFPLIEYKKKWQPFRTPGSGPKPDKKDRRIRYAARRDAYIYAKYRIDLSSAYEDTLTDLGITEVPIAYRKIKGEKGKGKCNIDFARDAFDFIISCDDCYVITLDISKFFESLDHSRIRQQWLRLLGLSDLPPDHAALYKSLTSYRWVDREAAYERLGFFGSKQAKNGTAIRGFLVPFDAMPRQLCNPARFRQKIAGKGSEPSIIQCNKDIYGIPQGTPISDLIANFYMMDVDVLLKKVADENSGKAWRYSDDIILVIKADDEHSARKIEEIVRLGVKNFGQELKIKEEKSSIHRYFKDIDGTHTFTHICGRGLNGLEYLGFRFDGRRVYLRDSTVSNLKRKMTYSARIRARRHKTRYSDRSKLDLIKSFNFDDLFQNFMRVEDFDKSKSVKNWTFWTYASRASESFGDMGRPILKQLRHLKPDGKRLVEEELSA